jgi:hypothetical protein
MSGHASLWRVPGLLLLASCSGPCRPETCVTFGPVQVIVPKPGVSSELGPYDPIGDLDLFGTSREPSVVRFQDRTWLAFRNASQALPSGDATIELLSSGDGREWQEEAAFWTGAELLRPQLVAWDGRLLLYFEARSPEPWDDAPLGMMATMRHDDGTWEEPAFSGDDGFLLRRAGAIDGRLFALGCPASDDRTARPIPGRLRLLGSDDGWSWDAGVEAPALDPTGGCPDTDLLASRDFRLLVLAPGTEESWAGASDGSLLCAGRPPERQPEKTGASTEPSQDPTAVWECAEGPRGLHHPLLLEALGGTWLVAETTIPMAGQAAGGSAHGGLDEPAGGATNHRLTLWRLDAVGRKTSFVTDWASSGGGATVLGPVTPVSGGAGVEDRRELAFEGPSGIARVEMQFHRTSADTR